MGESHTLLLQDVSLHILVVLQYISPKLHPEADARLVPMQTASTAE